MKCLVTGGAGFIGSNLAEALVKEGHDVVVLDNFRTGIMENIEKIKDKIRIVDGDLRKKEDVDDAANGVEVIFNQAAAGSSPMFFEDLKGSVSVNTDGFINILEAARRNDSKVIYASTSSLYANNKGPLTEDMNVSPPNFYSVTKLMNEQFADIFSNEYGLHTTGFRYLSVYGPNEKGKGIFANLVTQFLWSMTKKENPVLYGDGSQTRDFIYVDDIVRGNIMAVEKCNNEVINLGTGVATSLKELVSKLNGALGTQIEPKFVENKVKMYIREQNASVEKAKKLLNWEAKISLEEGIKNIIDFYS